MSKHARKRSRTNWLGLASFGFFLLLIGTIWVANPSRLAKDVEAFVKPENWRLTAVIQNSTIGNVTLPEPIEGQTYPDLYTAVMQFCFVFGVFSIVVLVLRFTFHEPIDRKADTVSSIAFWLAAGYFASLLIASPPIGWFGFVAGIIISGGLAIVASSIVKLLR
jgi:hypothetical protein